MLRVGAKARRMVCGLLLTAVIAAAPAHAFEPQTGSPKTGSPNSLAAADRIFEEVSLRAADLAAKTYQVPDRSLPAPFRELGYDGYIGIEFEGDRLSEFDGIKACKRLLDKLRAPA